MTANIRRATLDDLDAIALLFDAYRQFYRQAGNLSLARDFIEERLTHGESVILLAEQQGNALGFTQLYPSFSSVSACRIWVLNDLFVVPEVRSQRIGHQLLNAAREHALASGAKRIDLSTAIDNPAQKLYESLGYEKDIGFLHYSLTVA
jgi:ribosomal protein S18 acetylase RimI-like enzyme